MIIQCENCGTKFNLDESLVTHSDQKVRCSKCSHVFGVSFLQQSQMNEVQPDLSAEEEFDFAADESETGLPDEWDFDDTAEDGSMEEIESLETIFGGTADEDSDSTVSLLEDEGVVIDDESEPEEEYDTVFSAMDKSVPARKRVGISRAWVLLIVVLAVLIGAGYAISRFAPDLVSDFMALVSPEKAPKQATPVDLGGSRLQILTVDGLFVPSKKVKRLFLIHGKVLNQYPEPRSFLRVKGSIFDDTGKVVGQRLVYAGNPLTKESLPSLSMSQMEKVMENPDGADNANVNVQPDASVDFSIVFGGLPDNVSHFEVEPVSSSPAMKETDTTE